MDAFGAIHPWEKAGKDLDLVFKQGYVTGSCAKTRAWANYPSFPLLVGPAVYGFVPFPLSRKERKMGCTLLSLHDSGNRQDLNFRVGDDPSRDSTGDQKTQEIITMDRGRKAMPVQNKACMTRHIQKCQERHQQKVKERRKIRPRAYNSDLEYLAMYSSPPSCVI